MTKRENDPIVAEVRRVRAEHAAKFDNDIVAIFRDIHERQRMSGRQYVKYPPRPAVKLESTSISRHVGFNLVFLLLAPPVAFPHPPEKPLGRGMRSRNESGTKSLGGSLGLFLLSVLGIGKWWGFRRKIPTLSQI